jgi:hypothetical protein
MSLEILNPLHQRQQPKVEYTSLALKAMMDSLDEEQNYAILDLGPAVGANVDFFSELSSQLYVADLLRTLDSKHIGPTDEDFDWDPVFEELLPYEEGTRFDLVLLWDVLNYLSRPQIQAMGRRVGDFCGADALLYAMISTRRDIPALSRSYHIVSSNRLVYRTTSQAIRPCPLYKEPDLVRLMPQFKVKGTYILRNGIQEYLFVLRSH